MLWQCTWCGDRYPNPETHECNEATLIRYQTRRFSKEYKAWLATPAGQFAQHYAQRTVGGAG